MSLSIRAAACALSVLLLLSLIAVPKDAAAGAATLGAIEVWGHDADGDGLIDVVQLNVTVSVTSLGQFYVFAISSAGNQPEGDAAYLGVGTHILHAYIRGFYFYNWGVNGPYVLTVDLGDYSVGIIGSTTVTTPAWKASDFVPPGARLISMQPPWFRDTDGNGLYDTLQMNVTLNVTVPGTYRLSTMVNDAGNTNRFYVGDAASLAVGVTSRILTVDTSPIVTLGLVGPYTVTVSVQAWIGTTGTAISSLSAVTDTLTYDAFDGPWAWIRSGTTDNGVDLDGDGLFEQLVVHVPVHMGRPGTATVNGTLHAGTLELPETARPQALPAGDWVVDLPFPADALRSWGTSGPFQVDLGLKLNELPFYTNQTWITTGTYPVASLGDVSARVTSATYGPMDTDADGQADFFQVNATVDVAKAGDYFLRTTFSTSTGSVPVGRYMHLEPGMHVVSSRLSGIRVNRSGLTGFSSQIERLDASPWDASSLYVALGAPPVDPSHYEMRYPETLRGTVRSATGQPSDAVVLALKPADGFVASVRTGADGGYSLPVYNDSFIVFVQTMTYPDGPTTLGVTVDGATTRDIALSTMAPRGIAYQAVMSAWNVSSLSAGLNFGGMSAAALAVADLYGNFDGVANATELGWYARYAASPPIPGQAAYVSHSTPGEGVALRVDGRELAPGDAQVTAVGYEGAVVDPQTVTVVLQTSFRGPVIPYSDSHVVSVNQPADGRGYDSVLTLMLPSDAEWSEATASPAVNLTRLAPTGWLIDPTPPFMELHASESAWITSSPFDRVAPHAVLSGPASVERGERAAFRSNASSDREGIVNRTWTVDANGTLIHGYRESFNWTPIQIGVFDVGVRLRDVEGFESEANLTVRVVDTRAPPAPTGLTALVRNAEGGSVVDISWSPVTADDLGSYLVYRSSDNGTTFTVLGDSNGTSTSFTDAFVSSGGTFVYRVTASDRYGNEGLPSLSAQATVPGPGSSPPAGDAVLWAGAAAVVAAAGCVAAYVVLRRRSHRRRPEP